MIPYEQLCAALDRYVTRVRGTSATASTVAAASDVSLAPASFAAPAAAHPGDYDADRTMISNVPMTRPVDDASQEIDIGDVVDEEPA